MSDPLRTGAFCAYLISWLVLAVAGVGGAISRRHRRAATPVQITLPAVVGTLLQLAGSLLIAVFMEKGQLRPGQYELAGGMALAPLAAALFVWAIRSSPENRDSLATTGAFAWLRHPIYAAFLAMLLATGLIVSAGAKLLAAAFLYLAGTELRISSEEAELGRKFPAGYARYRLQTRWRYLPGLR